MAADLMTAARTSLAGVSAEGRDEPSGLAAAEVAAAAFLSALGVDLGDEHTCDTPRRMALAYAELLTAPPVTITSFEAGGYAGLVLVRGVAFASLCAHHALPFTGTADVGYVPGDRIAGVSKLARLVEATARHPQVQERMTEQIADSLERELRPRGVAVKIWASHLCMTARGARAAGSVMVTSALRGQLADDERLHSEWVRSTAGEPG
jgi:GTP cyclohydrolase IA